MGPIVFAAILLVLLFGNFEPLRPVPLLWWVGGDGGGVGGGGAYFAKKVYLSIFNLRLLYINKQYDVLISDMISIIIYGCLIKSSESFFFFCVRIKIFS